jgi:hypothetical protein
MAKINQKQKEAEDKERKLGFLADWINTASVGEENNYEYGYKKLKKKLQLTANNYKRNITVYVSSARQSDVKDLLHFLKPPKDRIPVSG